MSSPTTLGTIVAVITVGILVACKPSHSFQEGDKVRPSKDTNISKVLRANSKLTGPAAVCLNTLSDTKEYAALEGKPDSDKIAWLATGKWQVVGDVPMTIIDTKSDPKIVQVRYNPTLGSPHECWVKIEDLELINPR